MGLWHSGMSEGERFDTWRNLRAGRYSIVETHYQGETIKLLQPEGKALPSGQPRVAFNPSYTQVYADGWMVKEGDRA